ncbi:hypothetical protein [Arthrobacter methylotrophus]|uniref:hypothetical protein n=1 Tax=Arthrobacter methylotrophus TaxID=121291 RepID=UPI0031E580ED
MIPNIPKLSPEAGTADHLGAIGPSTDDDAGARCTTLAPGAHWPGSKVFLNADSVGSVDGLRPGVTVRAVELLACRGCGI